MTRFSEGPRRILAVTGVGRQASTTRRTICADAVGVAEQVRTAFGTARHASDGTAEVDVDDAHVELRRPDAAPHSANVSGSLSQICTASGRASSATPHSRSG